MSQLCVLVAMFFPFALLLIPHMAMGNAYTLFDVQDEKKDPVQCSTTLSRCDVTLSHSGLWGRGSAVCGGD
jgi:hypothetical protein